MPSYSMDFADINGDGGSVSNKGRSPKSGCHVTILAGFVLLLLAVILAVGVGLLVFFTQERDVTCKWEGDNFAIGGVADAVTRCREFIEDGGNSSGQICSLCPTSPPTSCPTSSPDTDITTVTFPTTATTTQAPAHPRDKYRLPTNIIPSHYKLRLKPHIYEGDPSDFYFEGDVSIDVRCDSNTDRITLHTTQLEIRLPDVSVSVKNGAPLIVRNISYDVEPHFFHIHLDTELSAGTFYEIRFAKFTGPLSTDGRGLYISSYRDNGQTVYLATTQFEAPYARKAFPCFDEPALKATFDTTLVRKINTGRTYRTLSNMPQTGNTRTGEWVEDHYKTTPITPTYLLAFIVCDYDALENDIMNITHRTWARPNAIQYAARAQQHGLKIFEYFETKFRPLYSTVISKMDHIAIPDFNAGAMENWGLITYREALLYKPGVASAADESWIAEVIAHEITHMWFGNVVSPLWWSWLWLNEAFASFWDFHSVGEIYPAWRTNDVAVVTGLHSVFTSDALASSHPMSADVETREEISSIFDAVTYTKGSFVVRMMNFIMGQDKFIEALNVYLDNKKFNNAEHKDLWEGLDSVGLTMSPSVNMTLKMDPWVTQMGYPVITVSRDGGNLVLSQSRFLLGSEDTTDDRYKDPPYKYTWEIPITYTSSQELNFNKTRTDIVWLHKDNTHDDISDPTAGQPDAWFLVNVQQYGYFRVNYDQQNWDALIKQLNTDHTVIHPINRAQIINDAWNLVKADILDMKTALRVLDYLSGELDYVPWRAFAREMDYVELMLDRSLLYSKLETFLRESVSTPLQELGLDITDEMPPVDIFARTQIARYACSYGHMTCVSLAKQQFDTWKSSGMNKIDPNLRYRFYCTAVEHGGLEEWNFIYQQYKIEDDATENSRLRQALACTKEPSLLTRLLLMTMDTNEIRTQDIRHTIQVVADNRWGRDIAFNFVLEHFPDLVDMMSASNMNRLIAAITAHFNSDYHLTLLQNFQNGADISAFLPAINQARAQTEANRDWLSKHYAVLETWLTGMGDSFQVNYRLPTSVIPDHYTVRLQPHIYGDNSSQFYFQGNCSIRVKCTTATATITLHVDRLNIDVANISVRQENSAKNLMDSATYEEVPHFYHLHLSESLEAEKFYIIEFNDFNGSLTTDGHGLYLSYYRDGEETIYLATTQMEPPYARKTFPCFDEPALKATFDISLVRKLNTGRNYTTLANSALKETHSIKDTDGSSWAVDTFVTTPIMPTYLLAFIVCDYLYWENETVSITPVKYRTWARPNAIQWAQRAQEYGLKLFHWMDTTFQPPYGNSSLSKLDNIAVPDFNFGAMENWGLITYREAILYQPGVTSAAYEFWMGRVTMHEHAHMWFGNYVSPLWWDWLWLNEAFATWWMHFGTDQVFPDWRCVDEWTSSRLYGVFQSDALATSHPMTAKVLSPAEINAIFDDVTYQKGGAILRMMQFVMGKDSFIKALNLYLANNLYGNAQASDLYAALDQQARTDNLRNLDILNMTRVMDPWVSQMGYPVVTVTREGGQFHLTQKRFLIGSAEDTDERYRETPYNYQWDIPITYMTSDETGTDRSRDDIHWLKMNENLTIVDAAAGDNSSWVLVNVQQIGYFRVLYDDNNWHALIRQLNNDHSVFTPINRGQIINDAWNLAKAGMLDLSVALSTLDYLQAETDLVAWRAFAREMDYVERMLEKTDLFPDLKSFIRDTVSSPLNSLTLDITEDMVPVDVFVRTLIAEYACTYEHVSCVNEARRMFTEWRNTGVNEINPNLRRQFYCTGIAQGGESDWQFVYTQFKASDDTTELTNLRYALSCSMDPVLLRRLLSMALDPAEIRTQDVASTIQWVAENPLGRDIAFQFFVDNFDSFKRLLDVLYLGRTLISVSSHFNTDYNLQQLHQLAEVRDVTVVKSVFDQAVAQTRSNIAWLDSNRDIIRNWLDRRGTTEPPPPLGSYRLPTDLKPYHYDLRLQPYIYNASAGFFFEGNVSVHFTCLNATEVIILHQDRLTINSSAITLTGAAPSSAQIRVTGVSEDVTFHFYKIHLDTRLAAGANYTLTFPQFRGNLRRSGEGLYLSSYRDGSETIYLATTQMEPTYARQVFPCFDEPHLKATFNTTLVRRTDTGRRYISLSNMPNISSDVVDNSWTADRFEKTMIMPTYLLAFIVCDYEHLSDNVETPSNEIVVSSVYARPNRIQDASQAQNYSVELFKWYNNKFRPGYETYISKVDHIAIPDFNAGAMENWGLITYREALLYNSMSTGGDLVWVAAVVSHELAHMWFGNKVSPLWWEWLWLNEAFANYYEGYAVEQLYPDWKLRSEVDMAAGIFYAMQVDSYSSSHPLSHYAETPREINNLFDTITYTKGGAIIQMMHFIMGSHFIPALNVYLHDNLLGSAEHRDLFDALDKYARNNNLNLNMTDIMEPWVTQMGYPVVHMRREENTLRLSQQRFLLGTAPVSDTGLYGYKYEVPITWTSSVEKNFNKTSDDIEFLTKESDLTIQLKDGHEEANWFVVNIRHNGYFRVNYEKDNWQALISQLNSDHTTIGAINRGALIDDAWNLVKAGMLDMRIALDLLEYMKKETEYPAWRAFARETDMMELMIERTELFMDFQRWMQGIVDGPLTTLGFELPHDNDPPILIFTRSWIVRDACKYKHPLCVTMATKSVLDWKNGLGNNINVNFRSRFYCTAITNGDHDMWDFIYSKYQEETHSTERSRLRNALGCSRDPTVLMTFLDMCLYDDEIPQRETYSCIEAVAGNRYGRDVALNFVMEHFPELLSSFSTTSLGNIVNLVTQHFHSNFHLAQLQFLRDTYDVSGITSRLDTIQRRTLTNMKWLEKNLQIIKDWLAAKVVKPSEPIDYRLPTSVVPHHYNLELQPEIYADDPNDFTFNGSVKIWIECKQATGVITLHAYRLDFEHIKNSMTLAWENGTDMTSWIQEVTYDEPRHFVTVHLARELSVNMNYTLAMEFSASMPGDGVGLYYSSYQAGDQTVYLATTKFEAPYARRAFPCFDEPALKATFNTTLIRRQNYNNRNYNSKSNNKLLNTDPIGNGTYVADTFMTTPRSPTYLLAFIVSDFLCLENATKDNTTYRTCARPNAYQHGQLAQDYGVWEFEWLEHHFEPEYIMPKLDNMAIPDFLSGAMENWGLITYREGLLYEEGVSTASDKDWIAEVVAHELAHMWFGNIVSPKWWNWLWLNEAFASFWDFHLVEKMLPSWRMTDQFISQSLHSTMASDSLRSSHPLTADVESPAEIQAIFDGVTYTKGAAIVRMMNFIMEENHFIGALNMYLQNQQYDVAEHQDLWDALDEYSVTHGLGLNMTERMDPWVTQMNYPVVHVSWTDGQLLLTQERFLSSSDSADDTDTAPYGYKWDIPITFVSSANTEFNVSSQDITWFNRTEPQVVISGVAVPDPSATNAWILVNVKQYGYFRVNYNAVAWNRIIEQLNRDSSVIDPINRAQIINDAWSLAKAGQLGMDIALKTLDFLKTDSDYVPWRAMARELGYLDDMLSRTHIYGLFQQYMVNLVNNTYFGLGPINSETADPIDVFQHDRIVSYACKYGIKHCQDDALQQFRAWRDNSSANIIDVNLRSIVYCNAIRRGTTDDWEFALDQYNVTDSASEKANLRSALACTNQVWLLQRYLDLAREARVIRAQDVRAAIEAVSNNHIGRDMAWMFLKQHFVSLQSYMTPGSFGRMIIYLTRYFNKEYQMEEVRSFMSDNDVSAADAAFKQVLEQTSLNMEWMKKHYATVASFLSQ